MHLFRTAQCKYDKYQVAIVNAHLTKNFKYRFPEKKKIDKSIKNVIYKQLVPCISLKIRIYLE